MEFFSDVVVTFNLSLGFTFPLKPLSLHLDTARAMQYFTRAVRAQRRRKVHIARRHFNGHAWAIQWASADAERVHCISGVVLGSGLEGRPAT
jgi:hypothetical protein